MLIAQISGLRRSRHSLFKNGGTCAGIECGEPQSRGLGVQSNDVDDNEHTRSGMSFVRMSST